MQTLTILDPHVVRSDESDTKTNHDFQLDLDRVALLPQRGTARECPRDFFGSAIAARECGVPSHPGKQALTSLPLWHKFELRNPGTFGAMYQFWCKKK